LTLQIKSISKDSHEITFSVARSNWEQWFLISSDRHHDNAHTKWELEKKHLDQALERKAGILDFGDLFCAMQGKFDKRADTSQCRPEHQRGRYLDSLVETAEDFYKPYAKNWLFMSPGNHETSITKRHETDLTERLAERLGKSKVGHPTVGAYCGYIRFKPQRQNADLRSVGSMLLYYHHGYGGGGPVTRGVIQTNRMGIYLPDAQIVVSGHTHDSWVMPISRSRIARSGNTFIDRQTHVRIPGYKDEFTGGNGWHNERGGPPKPNGAYWIRVYSAVEGSRETIEYEILEAR
jgi:hypothetical protein